MIKYKKIPNNENAIEIDGKVILSFDSRYKEYLKWRDENPALEQQLIDDLEKDIKNKELYNNGAPHTGSNDWTWYNKDGNIVLEREMESQDDKWKKKVEKLYNENGVLISQINYKDDRKEGEYHHWDGDGNKTVEGFYLEGENHGERRVYRKGKIHFMQTFKNGKLNGLAKYKTTDGKRDREGTYKNGKKDGKWSFYNKNEMKVWEGNYKRDIVEGEVVQYREDGSLKSKEIFTEGVLDGNYEYFYKNGTLKESGSIINTFMDTDTVTRDGEVLSYYRGGTLKSLETYECGIRSGPQKYFYKDGMVSQEGTYKAEGRVGSWIWYWPNGKKSREDQYDYKTQEFGKGRTFLYKILEWKDDGTKISIKKYNNKLLNGKSIFYHSNGNLSSVKTYKDDKLHGEYVDYFVDGESRAKGKMVSGEMHGVWTFWFHNKRKELECEFDWGTMIGVAKIYHDNGSLKEEINYD